MSKYQLLISEGNCSYYKNLQSSMRLEISRNHGSDLPDLEDILVLANSKNVCPYFSAKLEMMNSKLRVVTSSEFLSLSKQKQIFQGINKKECLLGVLLLNDLEQTLERKEEYLMDYKFFETSSKEVLEIQNALDQLTGELIYTAERLNLRL